MFSESIDFAHTWPDGSSVVGCERFEARKNYRGKESMAKRSISDCRRAIQIARGRDMTTLGMTVTLGGEKLLLTDLSPHISPIGPEKAALSGIKRFEINV